MTNAINEETARRRAEYQKYQRECGGLQGRAEERLQAGDAAGAYPLFREARRMQDEYYAEAEPGLLRDSITTQGRIVEDKIFLLHGLAQAAVQSGHLDEGREALDRALGLLEIEPTDLRSAILHSLAAIYQQQGDWDKAEASYQRAADDFAAFGAWERSAQALAGMADCAYSRGDPAGFLRLLNLAIAFAEMHGADRVLPQLLLKKFRFRLDADPEGGKSLREMKEELARYPDAENNPDFQADLDLLASEYEEKRGEFQSAEEYLESALEKAQANPAKKWSVLQAYVRFLQSRERTADALPRAEEALAISRALQIDPAIVQDLKLLIPLRLRTGDRAQIERAAGEIEEIRRRKNPEALAEILLVRALARFEGGEYVPALADAEEAERAAPTLQWRHKALEAQLAILKMMGRLEEAWAVNQKAVETLARRLDGLEKGALVKWKELLRDYRALHSSAAMLAAELGRKRESFRWAEGGRAQIVRRQLAGARLEEPLAAGGASEPTIDEARSWLAEESAALVVFTVGTKRTLALVIDPARKEPRAFFLPISERDLRRLFPGDAVSAEKWNDLVFAALPSLSSQILPPLREAVKGRRLLYLFPEEGLYFVPFAALAFADGSRLIDHCALAYAPSAAVLKWCRERGNGGKGLSCLAAGVGSAEAAGGGECFSFAEQARAIADLPSWPVKPRWLPEAKAGEFLDEAGKYSVLHLSCHGTTEPMALVPDSLSASRLKFADREVTAKEIGGIDGRWRARLVFLNACVSGKFNYELGSEVGGFWQAFLRAGAASLVATLAYVHPGAAERLALDFYREWLAGGVSKAEALRRAQLKLRALDPDPRRWATHVLIGDHR